MFGDADQMDYTVVAVILTRDCEILLLQLFHVSSLHEYGLRRFVDVEIPAPKTAARGVAKITVAQSLRACGSITSNSTLLRAEAS